MEIANDHVPLEFLLGQWSRGHQPTHSTHSCSLTALPPINTSLPSPNEAIASASFHSGADPSERTVLELQRLLKREGSTVRASMQLEQAWSKPKNVRRHHSATGDQTDNTSIDSNHSTSTSTTATAAPILSLEVAGHHAHVTRAQSMAQLLDEDKRRHRDLAERRQARRTILATQLRGQQRSTRAKLQSAERRRYEPSIHIEGTRGGDDKDGHGHEHGHGHEEIYGEPDTAVELLAVTRKSPQPHGMAHVSRTLNKRHWQQEHQQALQLAHEREDRLRHERRQRNQQTAAHNREARSRRMEASRNEKHTFAAIKGFGPSYLATLRTEPDPDSDDAHHDASPCDYTTHSMDMGILLTGSRQHTNSTQSMGVYEPLPGANVINMQSQWGRHTHGRHPQEEQEHEQVEKAHAIVARLHSRQQAVFSESRGPRLIGGGFAVDRHDKLKASSRAKVLHRDSSAPLNNSHNNITSSNNDDDENTERLQEMTAQASALSLAPSRKQVLQDWKTASRQR